MKEQYDAMFKDMMETLPPSSAKPFKRLIEIYDYSIIEKVKEFKDNSHNFTPDEWKEYKEQHKDEPILILNMIQDKNCPSKIVNEIVGDAIIRIHSSFSLTDYDICKIAPIHHELPEDFMYEIIDIDQRHSDGDFLISVHENLGIYPEKNIKYLCKFLVNNIDDSSFVEAISDSFLTLEDIAEDIFNKIIDKDFLIKLAKLSLLKPDANNIRTCIVNSNLLDVNNHEDEELINELFEEGLICKKLNKATSQIIQYYFDSFTNIDVEEYDFNDNEIFDILDQAIRKQFSTALEYDLMSKILSSTNKINANSIYCDDILKSIIMHTESESIMNLVLTLPFSKLMYLAANDNLTPEVIKKLTEIFFNDGVKGKEDDVILSNGDFNVILGHSLLRYTFPDECYKYLIIDAMEHHYDELATIASSDYTPECFLNDIMYHCVKNIEFKTKSIDVEMPMYKTIAMFQETPFNLDELVQTDLKLIFLSKINLAKRQGLIDNDICDLLLECCSTHFKDFYIIDYKMDSITFSKNLSYDHTLSDNESILLENDHLLSTVIDTIKFTSQKECDKVADVVKKLFSEIETNSNFLKSIFEEAGECFSGFIKDAYKETTIQPHDYSKYSDGNLKKAFLNFGDIVCLWAFEGNYVAKMLEFYQKMPEQLRLYTELKNEINKRNLDLKSDIEKLYEIDFLPF